MLASQKAVPHTATAGLIDGEADTGSEAATRPEKRGSVSEGENFMETLEGQQTLSRQMCATRLKRSLWVPKRHIQGPTAPPMDRLIPP